MDADARLLHQVYPAQLAHRHLGHARFWCAAVAAASRLGPGDPLPAAADGGLGRGLRWTGLPALRQHPAGRYVLAHMPPAAEAVRLAGDAVMTYGTWRRRPAVVVAGLALVGLGWSHGLGAGSPIVS
jgi:hypothetical protein